MKLSNKKVFYSALAMMLCFAMLAGCAPKAEPSASPSSTLAAESPAIETPEAMDGKFKAGTYTASGKGIYGADILISVTVDDSAILSIDVEEEETKGIGDYAIELVKNAILETQSLNVDAISGATLSSSVFIRGVKEALTEAGADIDALSSGEPYYEIYEDTKVDVVVVGAGAAGMLSAIELAEGGKSVILLEKQGILGGNTLLATTSLSGADSDTQKDNGTEAPAEEFYESLLSAPEVVPEYAKALAENSKFLIDRVAKGGGDVITPSSSSKFSLVTSDGGAPGLEVVAGLKSEMDRIGVDYRLNNAATEIIMEDGKASGVKVKIPNGEYTIESDTVLLTSGGYAASKELIDKYAPEWEVLGTTNSAGMTGDGQMMAEAVGAALTNMPEFSINPSAYNTGYSLLSFTAFRFAGAIMVNKAGERFTNELNSKYTEMTNDVLDQEDQLAYLVFDQAILDSNGLMKYYQSLGFLKEGDTLEALAEEIDVDAEGLKATIEKYNASAAAGVDADFGRPYIIIAMETPKYYACKIEPALHGTYGGVSISINGEALDAEGNVIPGLYAAGCVADMRVWSTNPTMHAPGAFGHIAAQHIIENS